MNYRFALATLGLLALVAFAIMLIVGPPTASIQSESKPRAPKGAVAAGLKAPKPLASSGRTFRVRFIEAATKNPVQATKVWVGSWYGGQSNEAGRVQFEPPSSETSVHVVARHVDYNDVSAAVSVSKEVGGETVVELTGRVVLDGTVRFADGAPAVGVFIRYAGRGRTADARTDDTGMYQLAPQVPTANAELAFAGKGFPTLQRTVDARESRTVDITLHQRAQVRVQVSARPTGMPPGGSASLRAACFVDGVLRKSGPMRLRGGSGTVIVPGSVGNAVRVVLRDAFGNQASSEARVVSSDFGPTAFVTFDALSALGATLTAEGVPVRNQHIGCRIGSRSLLFTTDAAGSVWLPVLGALRNLTFWSPLGLSQPIDGSDLVLGEHQSGLRKIALDATTPAIRVLNVPPEAVDKVKLKTEPDLGIGFPKTEVERDGRTTIEFRVPAGELQIVTDTVPGGWPLRVAAEQVVTIDYAELRHTGGLKAKLAKRGRVQIRRLSAKRPRWVDIASDLIGPMLQENLSPGAYSVFVSFADGGALLRVVDIHDGETTDIGEIEPESETVSVPATFDDVSLKGRSAYYRELPTRESVSRPVEVQKDGSWRMSPAKGRDLLVSIGRQLALTTAEHLQDGIRFPYEAAGCTVSLPALAGAVSQLFEVSRADFGVSVVLCGLADGSRGSVPCRIGDRYFIAIGSGGELAFSAASDGHVLTVRPISNVFVSRGEFPNGATHYSVGHESLGGMNISGLGWGSRPRRKIRGEGVRVPVCEGCVRRLYVRDASGVVQFATVASGGVSTWTRQR